MHNAIVAMYSRVIHQPSGIRRFGFRVSLLSPLRSVLRNGNPLLKFLGNGFTQPVAKRKPGSGLTAAGSQKSEIRNKERKNALIIYFCFLNTVFRRSLAFCTCSALRCTEDSIVYGVLSVDSDTVT